MTALRRVSTFAVGALFAVVFVCSGASATHGVVTHGKSAIGAHTAASKAATRTVEYATNSHKAQSPAPLNLTTVDPAADDSTPIFVVTPVAGNAATQHSATLFTTSERAPPAL